MSSHARYSLAPEIGRSYNALMLTTSHPTASRDRLAGFAAAVVICAMALAFCRANDARLARISDCARADLVAQGLDPAEEAGQLTEREAFARCENQ